MRIPISLGIISLVGLAFLSVQPASAVGYAALGDSVAAGAGLSTGTACDRSEVSYPYIVAQSQGLTLDHIACSGAKAGDLISYQGVDGPNMPPQLRTAFENGRPDLVSLTAGANDVHWRQFLQKCYYLTCGTTADDRTFKLLLGGLKLKLKAVFADIQLKSRLDPPRVIVTGYYQALSTNCSQIEPRLTRAEIAWMNARTADINAALRSAAAKRSSYVTYAPVSFKGHELCTADPWIQSATDAAPFHPNARGQQAIADAVMARLP